MKEDIELITLINPREFLSKLPWKTEQEITPIHVANLAKELLKGKTRYRIASNAKCTKHLMASLEERFAGKIFKIRMDGSDHFWSLINPAELEMKSEAKAKEKEDTTHYVPQEPEVVTLPVHDVRVETSVESLTPKHKDVEKKDKPAPAPAPEKEDMLKAYLLLELLMCGPYPSSKIKEISRVMGWKTPIYGEVNQVLRYYELKNVVDTSGKRMIKLTPEVKRGDEDVHLLISMLKSEISIPEDISYFIEMGEIKKTEEKETILPEEEEPENSPITETEEDKPMGIPKELQLKMLKKYIYDNGGREYGLFQSDVFSAIRVMSLDKIVCPEDDFRDDPDIKILRRSNKKYCGINETFFQIRKDYFDKLVKEAESVELEEVRTYVKESSKETPKENEPLVIEFLSNNEFDDDIEFDSKDYYERVHIWKYCMKVESKLQCLRLIEFYFSHKENMEFVNKNTLETLENIVLSV